MGGFQHESFVILGPQESGVVLGFVVECNFEGSWCVLHTRRYVACIQV